MTTQRKLKALVRERIDRTGESYTVARRVILNQRPAGDYVYRGGIHPETAALANVLANRGLVDPTTGDPLTEAMVLGVGGGLGAGYILWQFEQGDRRVVTTGFRNQWQYPVQWYEKTCGRLGVPIEMHETSSAPKARRLLDEALAEGRPAIGWISAPDLPYWHMPADESGWYGYPLVIVGPADGRAADSYLIDDRNVAPLTVESEGLAAARGRVSSYKNRLLVPDAAAAELDEETLIAAIEDGIADHLEHLSKKSDSFSLPAFRKWSKMLTNEKKPKGWPQVFADGRGLVGALVSVVESIDDVGLLGGNLRPLFAEFLDSAAAVLDRPPLRDAASSYRVAADAWVAVADAASPSRWMPADAPDVLAEVIAADRARRDAVRRGDAAAGEARAAAVRSAEIQSSGFIQLSDAERRTFFDALADAVASAHESEVAALDTLRSAW